jgi:putative ABC transport system ATP-binding protein
VLVEVEGVEFAYGRGDFRLQVDHFGLSRGECVAVIGPSGSGKTTLLHLIAGIRVPERGRIEVGGVELGGLSDAGRRAHRIRNMGLVFQEFELLDYLTVLDNALLPYRVTPALTLDREVVQRARGLAEALGLGDKLRRQPRALSHGERQRVGICRALVPDPLLLLADEPTGNLDPRTKERVIDLLLEHARRTDTALLTVTHDHALLDRFDRVVDVEPWAAGGPAS